MAGRRRAWGGAGGGARPPGPGARAAPEKSAAVEVVDDRSVILVASTNFPDPACDTRSGTMRQRGVYGAADSRAVITIGHTWMLQAHVCTIDEPHVVSGACSAACGACADEGQATGRPPVAVSCIAVTARTMRSRPDVPMCARGARRTPSPSSQGGRAVGGGPGRGSLLHGGRGRL